MSNDPHTGPGLQNFRDLLTAAASSIGEELERTGRRRQAVESESAGREEAVTEADILKEYDIRSVRALRAFGRVGSSAPPGTLLLDGFYSGDVKFQHRYARNIAVLMAAYCEANGRIWLNTGDGLRLARILEDTADRLLKDGLPRFAMTAYNEAANVYRKYEDNKSEDRCAFRRSGARRRSLRPWTPRRIMANLSAALFGYGYRPMRLLIWIVALIAGFTLYMRTLPRDGATTSDAVYVAVQNFINPIGLGDVKLLSPRWKTPLEIETYLGDILRNIFFVLLIRRWFRL